MYICVHVARGACDVLCMRVFLSVSLKEGDGVVINKPDQFAKVVLPKYYKHSNYQSFVRQVRAKQ